MGLVKQNMAFPRNKLDLLYHIKIKRTSSLESIYFTHFAMRYPVIVHIAHPSQPYRKYLNLALRRKCSLVVYHTGFRLIENLVRNGDR